MNTFHTKCSVGVNFHKGGHEFGVFENQKRPAGLGAMIRSNIWASS